MMAPFLWPKDDIALRVRLVISISLLAATAGLNALAPVLFALAVDRLTPSEIIGDGGEVVGVIAVTVLPLAVLLGYGAVHSFGKAMSELRWLLYGPIEQRLKRNVAMTVFRHLHELSMRFHIGRKTGALSRIMDNGTRGVDNLLMATVFMILPLVTEIVIILVVMLAFFDFVFTAIILGTFVLYTVALIIGSEWLRKHQRKAVVESAAAHGKAVDSLLNYETVKYFGNEDFVAGRYDDSLAKVERLTIKALTSRSVTGVIQVLILGLGLTGMILLAGNRIVAGSMEVFGFVLVNMYMLQIIRPLDRVGNLYRNIKQSFVDVEQMMGLLMEEPEVSDAPNATPLGGGDGKVEFRDVSFTYDVRRPLLDHVSFTVQAGRTVGIVGASGAGKTTLGRLLFRFYDPSSGQVLVDGADLRDVKVDTVRAAIGVVPQDAVLFNDSLYYNIAFGQPDATQDQVENAAKLAQINDFATGLPDGYDTVVGERGLKLSGGEKQRVAIARAILKNPRIFLFDEATSALDSKTEREIQKSLREVSKDTTTLIIAHRLSTVVHADEILVLEDGKTVERGTHDALLRDGGTYAMLWARQQKNLDLEAAD
ncbi:MAG: ABC transporter ATP-binding protein/permease [Alphaproteobacteria bacterium]|nr:ABC transporter ATP-binding protein/permease [Alphaproteobacteria bacterium]